MKPYTIKKAGKKGQGLFANKNFKKGQLIFHHDKSKLKKYTLDELSKFPDKKTEHADYVGYGKYVLDFHACSYMNHSCDPNTVIKMKTILKSDVFALKDIKKGDELTHDYAYTAVDQIDNKEGWEMKCSCGSEGCRGVVIGDFFKLPKKLQKKFYKYLPSSVKRKYPRK